MKYPQMSLRTRISFWVWCNMHWPEQVQFEMPMVADWDEDYFSLTFNHPRWWFAELGFRWHRIWAMACYLRGDHPPANMRIAEQRYEAKQLRSEI